MLTSRDFGAVRNKHRRLVLSLGVEVRLLTLLTSRVLVHVSVHAAVSNLGAVRVPIELAALLVVGCTVHRLPVEVQTLVVLGGPEQESSHLVLEVDIFILLSDWIDKLARKLVIFEAKLVCLHPELDLLPGLDRGVHLPDAYHLRMDLNREGYPHLHLVVEEVPLAFCVLIVIHVAIALLS